MLTGFIEQTSGEIIVDGYDMLKKPKKAKKEIGYMPEGVPLYTDLTVKEFVSYMAEIRKVDKKTRKEQVEKIIEKTGLKNVEKKLIKNLPIKNRFIQSFLYYVPYVTLAVMTFPAIMEATQSPLAGAAALAVGILAAWMGAGLFPVAVICCSLVFLLELLLL